VIYTTADSQPDARSARRAARYGVYCASVFRTSGVVSLQGFKG
jgi:hypothetical protein